MGKLSKDRVKGKGQRRKYSAQDYERWELLRIQGKSATEIALLVGAPKNTIAQYFRRKYLAYLESVAFDTKAISL
jgi:hypothetical protein